MNNNKLMKIILLIGRRGSIPRCLQRLKFIMFNMEFKKRELGMAPASIINFLSNEDTSRLAARFFITAIVFIMISCGVTPAHKNIETDEILIDVSYVDESFLRKYNTYDSFIEDEDHGRIAFTSNIPVKDFSWLSLSLDFDDRDELVYGIAEELYSLKELHPQKPLVVSWTEVGIMSVFGFSYRDKDGQKKYFVGRVGNYGSDPEEYNGPDFVITQFFPTK